MALARPAALSRLGLSWLGPSLLAAGCLPDDCEVCAPGALCGPHAAEERQVLAEYGGELESENADRRAAAVRAIGLTTREHENAPSVEVAAIVAKALVEERALTVRHQAAQLIALQEPKAAVQAVVATLKELRSGLVGGDLVPRLVGKGVPDETALAMTFLEEVLDAAGELPDDRCVSGLIGCLGAFPDEMRGQPAHLAACRSLVELRAAPGVDKVVGELEPFRDTPEIRRIHGLLENLALALDLEEYPEWGERCGDAWEKWFRSHKKLLPPRLGSFTAPRRPGASDK